MNPFRPSLRRSIALALLGMSLLGYLVVTTAWYFFSVARVSVYTIGWVAVTVAAEPAITVAHSGTVRAHPNPEGGLKVEVVLPAG